MQGKDVGRCGKKHHWKRNHTIMHGKDVRQKGVRKCEEEMLEYVRKRLWKTQEDYWKTNQTYMWGKMLKGHKKKIIGK